MFLFLWLHDATQRAGEMPGTGALGVSADGYGIVGPAFGKDAVFIHKANPVPVFGFFTAKGFIPDGRLYPDGRQGHVVMSDLTGAGGCFLGDDHFGRCTGRGLAGKAALALGAFTLALLQVLHFTGKLVPAVRGCIHLAEFISAQICCGRTAVLQRVLPLQTRNFVNIQRRAAFDTVGHGSAVPLPAFGTFHSMLLLIVVRSPDLHRQRQGSCSGGNRTSAHGSRAS